MIVQLSYFQGLGDIVAVGRLFKDVQEQRPDVKIHLSAPFRSLWRHNSTVSHTMGKVASKLDIHYFADVYRWCDEGKPTHMLKGMYDAFNAGTKLNIKLTKPKGYLEYAADPHPQVDGRYWVVMSGGRTKMMTKLWSATEMQRVVEFLRSYGIKVVNCGGFGGANSTHTHHNLQNVVSLVGKTQDESSFVDVIRHAEGVICGITGAMHIAAVYNKPCIVIAGGREPTAMYGYSEELRKVGAYGDSCEPVKVSHEIIHTLGLLDCCKLTGCNKAKLIGDDSRCKKVKVVDNTLLPECMHMIKAEHVVERLMKYVDAGIVPPLNVTTKITLPMLDAEIKSAVISKPPPVTPASLMTRPVRDVVGDKITVMVLCYGTYTGLARRCLNSIFNSVPASNLSVRVACNSCVPETIDYLKSLPLDKLYIHEENRCKYPVMREMLRDISCPVTTPYMVWLDDDAYVKEMDWLQQLRQTINEHHDKGGRLYGWIHWSKIMIPTTNQLVSESRRVKAIEWFKQANWWHDKPLWVDFKRRAPNGSYIRFVPGGFWAVHYDTAIECDIPDVRLVHNGGDITIGAQIEQAGYDIINFNKNKKVFESSGHKRRGRSDPPPWARR